MDKSNKKMIADINKHIVSFNENELYEILKILMNSSINENCIKTKKTGTQIRYRDIPDSILKIIHGFVKQRVEIKQTELKNI